MTLGSKTSCSAWPVGRQPSADGEDARIERGIVVGHVVAVDSRRGCRPGRVGDVRGDGHVEEIVGEPRVGKPVLAVGQVAQRVEDDRLRRLGASVSVLAALLFGPVAAGRADRSLTPCQLTDIPARAPTA